MGACELPFIIDRGCSWSRQHKKAWLRSQRCVRNIYYGYDQSLRARRKLYMF